MAKRKRTTALFDVIHKSRASSAAVKTRWWWPMGPRAAIKPTYRAIDRGLVSASAIAAANATAVASEPAAPIIPPTLAASSVGSTASSTSSTASGFGRAATPHASSPGGGSAGLSPMDVHVDRSSQRITMNFSYRSAIIVASSCVAGIVLAYIIGSHMSSGPAPVIAAGTSTAELRAGPAHPEALNVTPAPGNVAGGAGAVAGAGAASTGAGGTAANSANVPTTGPSPLYSFIDNPRVIGRQYVIVQSYPDRASADAAATLLGHNNIPCTVESNITGWAGLYCVVGQTGFDHTRGNTVFQHYIASINIQSTQFAHGSRAKLFHPRPITWKGN